MMGDQGVRRRGVKRVLAWALAVIVATGTLSAVAPAAVAVPAGGVVKTADLSKFQPGNIISDAAFFAAGTMSEAQIQSFLQSKVPTCQSGYTCLKDWYDTSRTTTADAMCGAYAGGIRERASTIIYKVAQACGINPQVLIVMLQKEQGLVNHTWPSEWRYTIAMGQGCPDTAACDTRYYGFFNQVYGAAWQMKRYANPAGTSKYFTWYAPGNTWNVRWHPNSACGSAPVHIQNQATANLYYYTPYQPNAAAIRAGYGEGDGCSSYGNRNFYQYFTDWFGSTQVPSNACAQPSSVTAADGEFVVNVASLNARSAPSTSCEPIARSLTQGTVVTRTGVSGDWWRIRIDGVSYWVFGSYLTPSAAPAYTASRLAGADRYATSVELSKAAYPGGAATVFLASGENFADALSAGAAAGRSGASLLLSAAGALPAVTASELARLAPTRVVVVGGEDRISAGVLAQVANAVPNAAIARISGVDRYDTSRLIAAEYFPQATTAYVVTGVGFADAVVASALGAAKGAPVILVDGAATGADAATTQALQARGIRQVIIAGGTPSVSAGIESTLAGSGLTVKRIGGRDRYETARLLAADAYPAGAADVMIATGEIFPDALAGAILAARRGSPIVTSPAACMPGGTKDWLRSAGTKSLTLLGGTPSLSDAVARSVRC